MGSSGLLLKGGKVLLHGFGDTVTASVQDILIKGNKIARIAPSIPADLSIRTVDCSDKLISPGFIDTHRHLWQTQLKGRHGDETLTQYMSTGNIVCAFYNGESTWLGVLAGCLESIDNGTTTIVDHSHNAWMQEIIFGGAQGFEDSGIRGIYCIGPPFATVRSFSPKLIVADEPFPSWWEESYEKLARQLQHGSGRVQLGLSYDSFVAGESLAKKVIGHARKTGSKIVTCHSVFDLKPVEELKKYDLLGPDILISHFNNHTVEATKELVKCGGHVSSTPSTELQMAHGYPVCFGQELGKISSLGIDCHSAAAASILTEARLALQSARSLYNQSFNDKGKIAPAVNIKAIEAFNLATIKGARACGMEKEIGSIAEGKLADLVIFDTTTPALATVVEHDPVVALLLHSSVGDIDTVIVDGLIRKENGRLLPVESNGKVWQWRDISKEVIKSRASIQKEIDKIDHDQVSKDLAALLGW